MIMKKIKSLGRSLFYLLNDLLSLLSKFSSSIIFSWLPVLFCLAIILAKCGVIPKTTLPISVGSSPLILSKEGLTTKDRDSINAFNSSMYGLINEGKGDSQAALDEYNRAIELQPENDVHYSNRGMFFAKMGDAQRALSDYNTAIKINPNNSITYDNRGVLKAQIGDLNGAFADYNQAIEIDPKYPASYRNRARIYLSRGDKQKAMNDSQKAQMLKEQGF